MAGKHPVMLVYNQNLYYGHASRFNNKKFRIGQFEAGLFIGRDGNVIDINAFADFLLKHTKNKKIMNNNINLIVKTPECILRLVSTPHIKRKDLKIFLNNNLNEYLPDLPCGYTVSYKLITERDGKNLVLIAVLPEEFSAAYIKVFNLAGIRINRFDCFQNAAVSYGNMDENSILILPFENRFGVIYYENGLQGSFRDIRLSKGENARDSIDMFTRLYRINVNTSVFFAEPDIGFASVIYPGIECKEINITDLLRRYG